jgi:hypothetical protein
MKENAIKLKNKYTGDIVFTLDYDKYLEHFGHKLIDVFYENYPRRLFKVNRDAFDIIE